MQRLPVNCRDAVDESYDPCHGRRCWYWWTWRLRVLVVVAVMVVMAHGGGVLWGGGIGGGRVTSLSLT